MKSVLRLIQAVRRGETDNLSPEDKRRLASLYHRLFSLPLLWVLCAPLSLDRIGRITRTDKASKNGHDYLTTYARYFRPLRFKPARILEIGVGGGEDFTGGYSIHMMHLYFAKARITAIDIVDKPFIHGRRKRFYQGSQADTAFLERVAAQEGPFDLIIDDGSHVCSHQHASFQALHRHLTPNGVYIFEDVETSFFPGYGGGQPGTPGFAGSPLNWAASLLPSLHHYYVTDPSAEMTGLGARLRGVHVIAGAIILEFGDNQQPRHRAW